jgi:hypothetical protein
MMSAHDWGLIAIGFMWGMAVTAFALVERHERRERRKEEAELRRIRGDDVPWRYRPDDGMHGLPRPTCNLPMPKVKPPRADVS